MIQLIDSRGDFGGKRRLSTARNSRHTDEQALRPAQVVELVCLKSDNFPGSSVENACQEGLPQTLAAKRSTWSSILQLEGETVRVLVPGTQPAFG